METYYFNKEVTVDSVYFRGRKQAKIYPKHMWIDNEDVTFEESGLTYNVQKEGKMLRLFDMTDGKVNYRLKLDPASFAWTLIRRVPAGA